MPTYEYRCPRGHEFEKFFRTISGAPTSVHCPTCGDVAERQISGGAGLLFKGSGFYLTDYGKNAHAHKGPKPSEKGAAGEGSSGASSATKGSTDAPSASGGSASGSGQGPAGTANHSGNSGSSNSAAGGSSGSPSGTPPSGGSSGSSGSSSKKE